MRIKDQDSIREIIAACKVTPSESIESEEIEFKEYRDIQALNNAKDLAEEVSALSNFRGGIIIIGIKDSSNVINHNWLSQLVGFEQGDVIEIEQRLKGKLKPSLEICAEYLDFESKFYLIIHVPHRRDSLITTSSGKVCIRDGRSSRPMEPHEVRQAVNNLQNYDWSADILDLDVIACLDTIALDEAYEDYCRRKQYSVESQPDKCAFLEAIGATNNGSLTKAGLLFLGKGNFIKQWLGAYEYRFSCKTRSEKLLINEVWEECIWRSIKFAKDYFNTCNINHEIKFKHNNYYAPILDDQAFHEAFINAIVHRDYSLDGMISIDFDIAQMTITNPGSFYGGVTSENIVIHPPRHRNKALAKLMMQFQLVDRAGMGIKRMGLGSLIYGREFPRFAESFDCVEVAMQAESVLPGIFVLVQGNPEAYGLIDLILINSLYRQGSISVNEAQKRIRSISTSWKSLKESVEKIEQIEFCGSKEGVYIRVKPTWNDFFDIRKTFSVTPTSTKHVKLYDYLMEFEEASNDEITTLLEHKNSNHTSKFLKEAKYVYRIGNSRNSRWLIRKDSGEK
ncbi:RNA-binding domain-containing protein [Microcoleus sp. D3_18_C4]|uniref:RNA-binding domain-containing protein n=1 Tax=Microcoleus sp. D3_18_C4 TaxID=3055335 RepID=UPI002FD0A5B7